MKRPAFQFYTGDWRKNSKLRRCSDAAKGAWVEIMCVLHDSEEYGVVRFPLKELVNAAGVKPTSVRELVDKGVLKGSDGKVPAYVHTPRHAGKSLDPVTLLEACDGPCWYSSRMVRDEWARGKRGGATRFTSDNQPPPNGSPTGRVGERTGAGSGDGASSSSSVPLSNTVSRNDSVPLRAVDNPEGRSSSKPTAATPMASKAQRQLAEQHRWTASPMPDDLKPRKPLGESEEHAA